MKNLSKMILLAQHDELAICHTKMKLTGVVSLLWPGLLLFNCGCMSASVRGRLGGTPSTMTPTPFPWDSPKVVIRNTVPKEDMLQVRALQSIYWKVCSCDSHTATWFYSQEWYCCCWYCLVCLFHPLVSVYCPAFHLLAWIAAEWIVWFVVCLVSAVPYMIWVSAVIGVVGKSSISGTYSQESILFHLLVAENLLVGWSRCAIVPKILLIIICSVSLILQYDLDCKKNTTSLTDISSFSV